MCRTGSLCLKEVSKVNTSACSSQLLGSQLVYLLSAKAFQIWDLTYQPYMILNAVLHVNQTLT